MCAGLYAQEAKAQDEVQETIETGKVAQDKMIFTIDGGEEKYNHIRLFNETSVPVFNCRVVILDENNKIQSVYGEYKFKRIDDQAGHTSTIMSGTKLGIQLPQEFDQEVSFVVEYKNFPVFDAIFVRLRDKKNAYTSEF